jgi:hypothetical protein
MQNTFKLVACFENLKNSYIGICRSLFCQNWKRKCGISLIIIVEPISEFSVTIIYEWLFMSGKKWKMYSVSLTTSRLGFYGLRRSLF